MAHPATHPAPASPPLVREHSRTARHHTRAGTAPAAPSSGAPPARGVVPSAGSQTRGKSTAQLQARLTQPQIAPGQVRGTLKYMHSRHSMYQQPGVGSRNKDKLITLPDGSTPEPTPSDQLFQVCAHSHIAMYHHNNNRTWSLPSRSRRAASPSRASPTAWTANGWKKSCR